MEGCTDDMQTVIAEDSLIRYGINYQVVITSKFVESNCNAMIFINQGTSTATLDSCFTLAPGESLSIPGNRKETGIHGFTIIFSPGAVNNLVVIRKFYSDFDVE